MREPSMVKRLRCELESQRMPFMRLIDNIIGLKRASTARPRITEEPQS